MLNQLKQLASKHHITLPDRDLSDRELNNIVAKIETICSVSHQGPALKNLTARIDRLLGSVDTTPLPPVNTADTVPIDELDELL